MSDAVKPALHGRDHCPGGVDPIPCLTSSAVLEVTKASLEDNADEEGFTSGTAFSTNDPETFAWETGDRFITLLKTGRFNCTLYVGINTDIDQFDRAPTNAAVVNTGLCVFNPANPTPHHMDQIYVDFSEINTAYGSETSLNITRTFAADLNELFEGSCLQPLCWIVPAASDPPSGTAIALAYLWVTKVSGATGYPGE